MYIVYYKALDGEQAETTLDQLPKLLESGAITEETIIWMDGCEACCRCHYLCGRRQCQCCCVGCKMLAVPTYPECHPLRALDVFYCVQAGRMGATG